MSLTPPPGRVFDAPVADRGCRTPRKYQMKPKLSPSRAGTPDAPVNLDLKAKDLGLVRVLDALPLPWCPKAFTYRMCSCSDKVTAARSSVGRTGAGPPASGQPGSKPVPPQLMVLRPGLDPGPSCVAGGKISPLDQTVSAAFMLHLLHYLFFFSLLFVVPLFVTLLKNMWQ